MKADITSLFSDRARENQDFTNKVILPTDYEFNELKKIIDVFPELTSLDYAPKKFMKLIGHMFGYDYLDTEDPEVQREIYKHLVQIYHEKGSQGLFEDALRYAHDENYAIGKMSYYHGDIEPSDFSITRPRDSMFRFDKTTWDRFKYPEMNTVALGIVDVECSKWTSRTETYLDELIPIGIRYAITISKNITGDGTDESLVMPFKSDIVEEVIYEPGILTPYISSRSTFIFDSRRADRSIIDGSSVISYMSETEQDLTSVVYPPVRASDRMYKCANVPKWMTPKMADEQFYGRILTA